MAKKKIDSYEFENLFEIIYFIRIANEKYDAIDTL